MLLSSSSIAFPGVLFQKGALENYLNHLLLWLFGFNLFGSSDQTNNGSEISDPDYVNCKCRK
jgi:hypothetical protein